MNLRLATSEQGGAMVLSAHGEIDVATAPLLRQEIVEIASAGSGPLVIDLEGVDFLDSTGLGVIVSGLKRFRTLGGDVLLVSTRPGILRVFEITGLTQVFAIHATVAAAVAAAVSGP